MTGKELDDHDEVHDARELAEAIAAREAAAREWAGELDFSTLQKVPAEYVSDERLTRRGDAVWRVRFRDGRHLLVVLELQSTDDPRMALRIVVYTGLLYQELARNKEPVLDEHRRLPTVLPVVLYNGEDPWEAADEVSELIQPVDGALASYRPRLRHYVLDERHAGEDDLPGRNLVTAVIRLEQSRFLSDLIPVTEILQDRPRSPEDDELSQALADWGQEILGRVAPEGEQLPAKMTLREVSMTVVERVSEWPKQWAREGREQGMREGLEQGIEQGFERGLAHERALLRRMAASRFGADTAERLSEVLADIADPERLAEVGEWLVRCDTGGEFLARVVRAGTSRPLPPWRTTSRHPETSVATIARPQAAASSNVLGNPSP